MPGMADSTTREQAAFLQIGEAADLTGLTQRTLRFYEEKGLLNPPTRMEGGFRLYSNDDIERIERIKQLKELLGFSLADIKTLIDAEDERLQLKAGWRADAGNAEKGAHIRKVRELTLHQLQLLDERMRGMADFREGLVKRLARYDQLLLEYGEASGATTR